MPIVVKNLSYIYNEGTPFSKKALDNVSLTIEDGDFFGIIGHTGSGKSTLIQHFNALVKPASGEVFIDGQNIFEKGTDLKALRGKAGMVFQYPEYQLFAETVEEDVAFGIKNFYGIKNPKKKNGNGNALDEAQVKEMVKQAIEAVGLDYAKIKDKSPFDLSGGQKRRAAIAGVIAVKPKILILDEPTAGLDPRGKNEILALLHSLKEKFIPTIIMISHDMNEIAKNCNRIAVIKESRVVCVKTPAKLFSDDKLIRETGLDIPETVKLASMLREKGLDIEKTVFSIDTLSDNIIRALRQRKKEGENA